MSSEFLGEIVSWQVVDIIYAFPLKRMRDDHNKQHIIDLKIVQPIGIIGLK